MCKVMLAFLVGILTVDQGASTVVEYGLKVEAAFVGTGDKPAAIPRSMQRSLPDGSAEWTITTDGASIRSALSGRYLDMPSGIVVLQQDGQPERYVINPADHTYYGRPAEGLPPDEVLESVSVVAGNETLDIAGFKTQKVVIQFRRPLPAEVQKAGGPAFMQTEIVNWCATDLKLGARLTTAIDRRVQAFTPRQLAEQVAKLCPVALRSAYRLVSSTPDYAIVSSVTGIKRVPGSSTLFQLPGEYKRTTPQ